MVRIPIKKYEIDTSILEGIRISAAVHSDVYAQQYLLLAAHHEEETKWMYDRIEELEELREPIKDGDKWLIQPIESINLCWYDGPMLDASVIDMGSDLLPHCRFSIELRVDERAFYQKESDPGAVFYRLSIDELEAMVELYRKHAPKGGKAIGV